MEGIFKCLPLKHPTQLPPQKGARTTPEGPPWSSEVLHPAKAMTRVVMETSALSGLKNDQSTERFPGGREPGWLSWGAGAAPCPGGAGGLHGLPWSPGPTQGLTTHHGAKEETLSHYRLSLPLPWHQQREEARAAQAHV